MSSVVIAGNTSGSVTLSAPDVAGTTTITLPSTSGTMATTATLGGGATETTSAVNITLTSASNRVQAISMTASSKTVSLPNATTISSAGGPIFFIINTGSITFGVTNYAGALIASVNPNTGYYFTLSNTTNSNTGWAISSQPAQYGSYAPTTASSAITLNASVNANSVSMDQLSANTYLAAWIDTTNKINIVVATLSGGTFSYGTLVQTAAITNIFQVVVVALSSTTALVFYQTGTASVAQAGYVYGVSIAGTTATLSTLSGNIGSGPSSGFVTGMAACKIDSTTAHYSWSNTSASLASKVVTYNGASAPTTGVAVTVSSANFNNTNNSQVYVNSTLIDTGKVGVFWVNYNTGYIFGRIHTISGTTITQGTETTLYLENNDNFGRVWTYSTTEVSKLGPSGSASFAISGTTITVNSSTIAVVSAYVLPAKITSTLYADASKTYFYTPTVGFAYGSALNSIGQSFYNIGFSGGFFGSTSPVGMISQVYNNNTRYPQLYINQQVT